MGSFGQGGFGGDGRALLAKTYINLKKPHIKYHKDRGLIMSVERQKLDEEFEKLKKTIKRPNILLVGGTGAGKSSLINHIFGGDIAASGTGRPITQNIDRYEDEGSKVVIYDSKGYEIGSEKEKQFMDDVIGLCQKDSQASETIHIVWYFIQAPGSRITRFDIESIRKIQESKTPVAIIFTKSDLVNADDTESLKSEISESLSNLAYFEVSTKTDLPEPTLSELEQELTNLIAWTHGQLPEALRFAFIAEQRTNLEEKRQKARTMVHQHATGAFATGFTPIPGSDAPILLANQYALLARILYLFGLDRDDDRYSMLIKGAITQILPTLGKWGVAQLVKAFPGIGTFIGGFINGTVAASLTAAFGYAISETVHYARSKNLESFSGESDFIDNVEAFFQETLNAELKKRNWNEQ